MSKNKITVLLVEDEQTLAMIIKDTLEENDFIIHTANDGEEGLSLFFELHPDLLSSRSQSDQNLPDSVPGSPVCHLQPVFLWK